MASTSLEKLHTPLVNLQCLHTHAKLRDQKSFKLETNALWLDLSDWIEDAHFSPAHLLNVLKTTRLSNCATQLNRDAVSENSMYASSSTTITGSFKRLIKSSSARRLPSGLFGEVTNINLGQCALTASLNNGVISWWYGLENVNASVPTQPRFTHPPYIEMITW